MRTPQRRSQPGILPALLIACLALGVTSDALAASTVAAANRTISEFKRTDPGMARFFDDSAGYAVFPTVGKGGLVFGGGYGQGILYERGKPIGDTSITQLTVGLQAGGQSYSEIIFFENEKALQDFKSGDFELSAQVSAVALKSGASANAKYREGVAVFTAAKDGLMAEGSIGGQKFNFKPFSADEK